MPGDIPSNIPPKSGDAVAQRRINTDVIADKYARKQTFSGLLWTVIDGDLERAKGIEPSSLAWEAKALPLSYARL
jgi:hypothetical protein